MSTEQEFDVNAFLNESIDGELDTKIIPIPEGVYDAQIGTGDKDVDVARGISPKTNRPWMRLDVRMNITDPNLIAQLQRDQVTVRHSIMLDLNEAGKVDMRPQRNVNLGKLRDAVNQNRPGPWSFLNLKGATLKVKIKQRKADDGSDNVYSDVVAVTKAQ